MTDCAEIAAANPDGPSDPRLDPRRVRRLPADGAGAVPLVGVVHDQPASVYRAVTLGTEGVDVPLRSRGRCRP